MKTYRGNPAAARCYVEAGRVRADEYYLAEGSGIAQHYTASPEGGARALAPLSGDQYEAWVAGIDPTTGVPKGHLRHDDSAVRFVEIVVNGPKSWSLAAALHEDISAAYDAAQDAAARQIIGWLAQHATTRIGPRGQQIQVPVERLDAAVIRHHSSRAGDPHRHLHLQINTRVLAEGTWRGLHTVGVRDSLDALNGIGHAAVMTDPGFRAALARHGYTFDPDDEVLALAKYVAPFSARAAQIGRNIDRYEADWRTANPGRGPGPRLRLAWDRRAWADARPDKVIPRNGAEMTHEWVAELHGLGYRDPHRPACINPTSIASIDRNQVVAETLTRLAAHHSRWNAADVRGQIEHLIARRNIVTDSAIRTELAEDLTARALAECLPLLARDGLPEHVRGLTSRHVSAVEADLAARLTERAETLAAARERPEAGAGDGLDVAQREVVATLAGQARLVVVEGAAGAGKTTTLAATRAALQLSGHRLVVVTPSRKAARVASHQVGSTSSSAAWLVHQHGFRWSDDGGWTRLPLAATDPATGTIFSGPSDEAVLQAGDLLLCDEAGMLDQDTAHALLTIADEVDARVALVGDRHQLPAIGRGGVLELAARYAAPEACLTLDTLHRFADPDYAQLTLAMRSGDDPHAVFDTLRTGGRIRLHGSEVERRQAVAGQAVEAIAAGEPAALLADTREQAGELNAVIRDRLVALGRVDDARAITTAGGQRVGVEDRVATRRNDSDLRVANRDTWTLIDVASDGRVTVVGEQGQRTLPAAYAREHLELAYATTVHGAQGETTTTGHLMLGQHTTGAAAYVGMTRGRESNIAHLVATSVDEAREQWIDTFTRDRADLGPADAARLAEREASRYARLRPLDDVLHELHEAWTAQADSRLRLTRAEQYRELLTGIVPLRSQRDATLPRLKRDRDDAVAVAETATKAAERVEADVTAHASAIASTLQREWDQQRDPARRAAQVIRDGSGMFAQRHGKVRRASEQLTHWATTWRPYLPAMPAGPDDIVNVAGWFDDTVGIRSGFDQYARATAEQAHPDYAAAHAAAARAQHRADQARRAYHDAASSYDQALSRYGRLAHIDNPEGVLTELDQHLTTLRGNAKTTRDGVSSLLAEPTVRALPADRLTTEHARWKAHRQAEREARNRQRGIEQLRHGTRPNAHPRPETRRSPTPDRARGISR